RQAEQDARVLAGRHKVAGPRLHARLQGGFPVAVFHPGRVAHRFDLDARRLRLGAGKQVNSEQHACTTGQHTHGTLLHDRWQAMYAHLGILWERGASLNGAQIKMPRHKPGHKLTQQDEEESVEEQSMPSQTANSWVRSCGAWPLV